MAVTIEESWKQQLKTEFEQPYFKQLSQFIKTEYALHTCYPKGKDVFAAFDHSPFKDTKVVIIGQDPYHGPGQANGLCFSVKDGIAHPPSLINIFKEIETDLGKPYPAKWQFRTLGGARGAFIERHFDREGARSGQPPKKGLGNLYGCRYQKAVRPTGRPDLYALGRICQKKGIAHRQKEASYTHFRASFALKCQPGVLVRQPAF